MSDRKPLPGKFVWFEHLSRDPKKAQGFYGGVLGWKVAPFPMGEATYDMILAGDTLDSMIGGYALPKNDRQPSHWISYVSVEDFDADATIPMSPEDIPGVGRFGVMVDPTGAMLAIIKPLPTQTQP
jgi:uncharacterized protein